VLVEDPRPSGAPERLRENLRIHPDPRLEPRRDHQLGPLRTVRACGGAVAQIDGNVCGLVASHLAQQFLRLVEQSRMESDPARWSMATAEGGSEAWADLETGSFDEGGEGPDSSPFR
jgi:hypothetical protein